MCSLPPQFQVAGTWRSRRERGRCGTGLERGSRHTFARRIFQKLTCVFSRCFGDATVFELAGSDKRSEGGGIHEACCTKYLADGFVKDNLERERGRYLDCTPAPEEVASVRLLVRPASRDRSVGCVRLHCCERPVRPLSPTQNPDSGLLMAGRKRGKSRSPFHSSEFDTGLVQAATQPSVNGQAKSDRRCIVAGDWEYFLFLVTSGHSVRLLLIPGCPISGWEGSAGASVRD